MVGKGSVVVNVPNLLEGNVMRNVVSDAPRENRSPTAFHSSNPPYHGITRDAEGRKTLKTPDSLPNTAMPSHCRSHSHE